MMRVAVIGHGLWGDSLRLYPAKYIHLLHLGLKKIGGQVEICYITNALSRGAMHACVDGLDVLFVPSVLRVHHVARAVRLARPDLIAVHGGFGSLLTARRLSSQIERPVIFTLHYEQRSLRTFIRDLVQVGSLRRMYLPAYVAPTNALRWIINGIACLIAPSRRIEAMLTGVSVGTPIEFLPPPVDLKWFNPYRPYEIGSPIDKVITEDVRPIVFYFGSADPARGLSRLIYATLHVRDSVSAPICVLLIRDERMIPPRLQSVIKQNKRLFIVIQRTVDDVRPYLYCADVVALPFLESYATAVPYTLLEAMAMERAVVATRIGAISEYLEHGSTGFLLDTAEVQELTNGLVQLLSQPIFREQLGKAARERIMKQNRLETVSMRLKEVYDAFR